MSDVRFALRQLAKAPGFTVVTLLTLAVGIGSATVVFSTVNALLFKPLPHITAPEDRLMYAAQYHHARPDEPHDWSLPDFTFVRERATTLAGFWIHHNRTAIIPGGDSPQRLLDVEISWDAFAHLGVQPIRGRSFTVADTLPSSDAVALITAELWKSRFGSAEDAVGRTVVLNGQPTTIIGVMPPGWRYPDFADIWTPLRIDPETVRQRGYWGYSGRVLLKPGVTLAQAQAELDSLMRILQREFPATNADIGARLQPIREEAVEGFAHFTVLLFGAVLLVFLIACVNVANLLLVRSAARSKEIAIRLALGADRRRIVAQLIVESALLALLGGLGGIIFGLWGSDAMAAAFPIELPFWLSFEFDFIVFAFVFGLSLLAALIFGLAPALRVSRPDVVNELKEGGRSAETSGPRAIRLRNLLVVAEIALALILLVGAGLMMRSFLELRATEPGFDANNVLTFRTGLPLMMVEGKPDESGRFFEQLVTRLAALPGVESAGLVNWLPGRDGTGMVIPVFPARESRPLNAAEAPTVLHRVVTPGYFSAVRIPLIAGRNFDELRDRKAAPAVVIVDAEFATRHFGAPARAVGERLLVLEGKAADTKPSTVEIIGVVGAIRHRLDRADERPTLYAPFSQGPENFMSVVIRTSGEPTRHLRLAKDAVVSVNRDIPTYDEHTLEDVLLRTDSVWQLRFFSFLFTVFGGVAVFLACIGIYGVISYSVAQRIQELGVRLALGAQPREIIRLVLRHGAQLVGLGLGTGLIAAFFLATLLTGVLHGVSPRDPPTFAIVPLLLAAVAMLACWLPSRRATLIEPNAALRTQ